MPTSPPDTGDASPRRFRKLWIVLAALLGLAVVVRVALPYAIQWGVGWGVMRQLGYAAHLENIDLSFFRELSQRFGAPGDFAQAYVLAHEVGPHVQNLLGLTDQVTALQRRAGSKEEANELSVRLELQADCFAGVFGHHNRQWLEAGDVEEGLRAAAAIGDDNLQQQAQGYVSPESWTHGSSDMRVRWLRRGLESGDPEACDTFDVGRL